MLLSNDFLYQAPTAGPPIGGILLPFDELAPDCATLPPYATSTSSESRLLLRKYSTPPNTNTKAPTGTSQPKFSTNQLEALFTVVPTAAIVSSIPSLVLEPPSVLSVELELSGFSVVDEELELVLLSDPLVDGSKVVGDVGNIVVGAGGGLVAWLVVGVVGLTVEVVGGGGGGAS